MQWPSTSFTSSSPGRPHTSVYTGVHAAAQVTVNPARTPIDRFFPDCCSAVHTSKDLSNFPSSFTSLTQGYPLTRSFGWDIFAVGHGGRRPLDIPASCRVVASVSDLRANAPSPPDSFNSHPPHESTRRFSTTRLCDPAKLLALPGSTCTLIHRDRQVDYSGGRPVSLEPLSCAPLLTLSDLPARAGIDQEGRAFGGLCVLRLASFTTLSAL